MKAFSLIIVSSLMSLSAFAGTTQQQIDERIVTMRWPFQVHRVEKPIHDESWLKIPETWKPARTQPVDCRRYAWVSASTGITFYVTIAFAQDANEARMLIQNYWMRIQAGGRPGGTPNYGTDEIMHVSDRHLVARWGCNVAAITSRSDLASVEIPKIMQRLQQILSMTEK
jgi:hypothetical protein